MRLLKLAQHMRSGLHSQEDVTQAEPGQVSKLKFNLAFFVVT